LRRALLAAFAVLLLHAAPSAANTCKNFSLVENGGTATASSQYPGWNATAVNNGFRDTQSGHYWNDNSNGVYPDWVQLEWSTPQTINRIVVRGPAGAMVLGRATLQYWDTTTSAWVDVVGRTGQDNPIVNWTMLAEGDDTKQFDLTPITTTKVRVLVDAGTQEGWSVLDEIEAYNIDGNCLEPGQQCVNIAPDGDLTASSVHSSGDYPLAGVTNGQRESGTTKGYWNDGTNGTWPDWVQVAWDQPERVSRIVVRIPIARPDFPLGEITLRRTVVQYWDDANSAWVDVVSRSDANPILDWTGPIGYADGSETRELEFDTVVTSKVRVVVEDGSSDGWSWLDEVEVYDHDRCRTPSNRVNIALADNGGISTASSTFTVWAPKALNDGIRQSAGNYYWNDGTNGVWPDWAQIEWTRPRTVDRIVVRGMTFPPGWTIGYRTLRRTRIQYWDQATSTWEDVAGHAGQDNPILAWVMPDGPADGSERRQFDFDSVTTTKIRALIEEGSTDGWSWLEEIEAYWTK
jgi:hypothetical protein